MSALPSLVVIGEESVVHECLRRILAAQFSLKAVFTSSPEVEQWCQEKKVSVYDRNEDIEKCVQAKSFDYLLSINNPRILKANHLALPRVITINYHDSPLPAYAGVNSTCWALIHGEDHHGVTWHVVEPGIDDGDILQARTVQIADDDTAGTLNLKCLSACLDAFDALLKNLRDGSLSRQPQDLSKRSYFGLNRLPPSMGILDFQKDSETNYNLARACLFGNHDNQLGSAKIMTPAGTFLVVTRVSLGNGTGHPGRITAVGDGHLEVDTANGNLIMEVKDVNGLSVKKETLESRHHLVKDLTLGELPEVNENLLTEIRKKEKYWVKQLTQYNPTSIRSQLFGTTYIECGDPFDFEEKRVDITAKSDCNAEQVVTFLGRVCCTDSVHVGVVADIEDAPRPLQPMLSDVIPAIIKMDFSETTSSNVVLCAQALAEFGKKKTYIQDVFRRYTSLKEVENRPYHNLVIGEDKDVSEERRRRLLADCKVLVLLVKRQLQVYYKSRDESTCGQVVELLKYLPQFLDGAGGMALRDVDLISPEDAAALYGKPVTSKETGEERDLMDYVNDFFRSQPDWPAVRSSKIELTYSQLREKVMDMADLFSSVWPDSHVPLENSVALYMPNSVSYILSVMVCVSSRRHFVPLPVEHPSERVNFTLNDARASVIIVNKSQYDKGGLDHLQPRILCKVSPEVFPVEEELFLVSVELDTKDGDKETATVVPNCCYIIYTSGSTGRPKGVQCHRPGVVNLSKGQIKFWDLDKHDVTAQFASIGFDAVISEMFTVFLSGGTLAVLYTDERQGDEFKKVMVDLNVTVMTLPPGMWNVYDPKEFPTVKKAITAGEACTRPIATKWASHARFFNAYGPAENTVCATIFEFNPKQGTDGDLQDLPIGYGIENVQVYVFDEFLKPVPPHVVGELYIGGNSLSAGYIGHARAMNEIRFLPNPLCQGQLLYRSGDHAVASENGDLTFVGRLDDQVKIRGQMVHLSGVEKVVLSFPGVSEAAVVKHQVGQSDAALAAFVAPADLSKSELMAYLQSKLNKYMIPSYVKFMDVSEFPKNLSGKIDRKKLETDESVMRRDTSDVLPPATPTERRLAEIWADLLGLKLAIVSQDDEFEDLGGNSLKNVQLLEIIKRDFAVSLRYTDIEDGTTLSEMAAEIDQAMQ